MYVSIYSNILYINDGKIITVNGPLNFRPYGFFVYSCMTRSFLIVNITKNVASSYIDHDLLSTVNSMLSLRSDNKPSAAQVYTPTFSNVKFISFISITVLSINIT